MLGLAAELGQFRPKDCAHIPHDLLHPFQVPRGEYRVPVLRDENQLDVHAETQCRKTVPASAYVAVPGHEIKYAGYCAAPVQLPLLPGSGPACASPKWVLK
jgi:hypothetical protein